MLYFSGVCIVLYPTYILVLEEAVVYTVDKYVLLQASSSVPSEEFRAPLEWTVIYHCHSIFTGTTGKENVRALFCVQSVLAGGVTAARELGTEGRMCLGWEFLYHLTTPISPYCKISPIWQLAQLKLMSCVRITKCGEKA